MTDIIMPRLSDSMEEGTILKWLKATGEEVALGEPLAEIETDKATMTYEADAAGFLELVADEGDTLAIGSVIGRLHPDAAAATGAGGGGGAASAVAEPSANGSDESEAAASEPEPAAEPAPDDAEGAPTPAAAPAGNGAAAPAAAPPASEGGGARVKASPVARRIARELGVDLASLAGSGPEGRIVKADVMAASGGAATATAAATVTATAPAPAAPAGQPESAASPADAGAAKGRVEVVEPNRTQQVIARRMSAAKATIPEFQVTVDVDMEAAFELREQLRGQAEPLPSVNDFVIKACALALRAHPRMNSAYVDGHFEFYSRVNIGMAVASEGSLVVPTIFDADRRSLVEIATSARALAAKVRDNTVSPPELAAGTFTISNLGMFGVARFTAVINPPQAAILAVGAAQPRAVVGEDGGVTARRITELTLSADHRIVYGADAADFLGTVRKRLERPAGLLL